MFARNVGGLDRIARIVAGLALLLGFFLNADASLRVLYLIGIVPLFTGLFGTCPMYRLFGFSTCPVQRR